MSYAGFWIRVGAYIIDAIVLAVVGGIIGGLFGGAAGSANDPMGFMAGGSLLLNLISIVIGIGYFAGMESSSWQATLGKKVLGLVVVDENGQRISLAKGIGRYFGKILSALIVLIGFIMVAFTEKKQGLHDMLAGTLVLKGAPGEYGTAGVFD